jgi:hypothetical protein
MIVMRESERNATRVRSGNLRVGGAGGPAFELQKPPQLRVPRPSRRRRAGTTTAYTTGGVEREHIRGQTVLTPIQPGHTRMPLVGQQYDVRCMTTIGVTSVCPRISLEHLTSRRGTDFPVCRSLNRKRRIAFYHILLEIRTFVLAPEPCSVSNPIENRSAIRLVLANDGTRQADEIRF